MEKAEESSLEQRKLPSGSETSERAKESVNNKEQKHESDGSSSPSRCPICLGPPENEAKSGSCSHFFCFSCLKEWSKIKAECPLCKTPIRSIFYNIKSDTEFDEYPVAVPKPSLGPSLSSDDHLMNLSFRYWRSAMHRDFFSRSYVPRSNISDRPLLRSTHDDVAIRTRRSYYWRHQRVVHVDTRNRVRECSATFYRSNPSQIFRLVPWLRRELKVLFGNRNRSVMEETYKKIMSSLPFHDISSDSFKTMVNEYLHQHTDHFIHEFLSFARSPYTMEEYDRNARYTAQTNSSSNVNAPIHAPWGYRRGISSRWDYSPDANRDSYGQSDQSVMLSQTPWIEDVTPPLLSMISLVHRSDLNDSSSNSGYQHSNEYSHGAQRNHSGSLYSGGYTLSSQGLLPVRNAPREMEPPLQFQIPPVFFRPFETPASQYQQMENRRQHIGDFQGNGSRQRRSSTSRRRRANNIPPPDPSAVIVISSTSEEDTPGPAPRKKSKTIHYKPADFTEKLNKKSNENEPVKVKLEIPRRSSSSSTSSNNRVDSDSDSSAVEFVGYIKPRHLRTPDCFIDLRSSDDEQPGPSSKIISFEKPQFVQSTSSIPLDRSSDWTPPDSTIGPLLSTSEGFHHVHRPSELNEVDPSVPTMEYASESNQSMRAGNDADDEDDQTGRENILTLSSLSNPDESNHSKLKGHPKKVFPRGKVYINLAEPKRFYGSSDSELDVALVKEVPTAARSLDSPGFASSREGHTDVMRTTPHRVTLKSVVSIPTKTMETSEFKSDDRKLTSSDVSSPERPKRKRKKKRHSRHDESHSTGSKPKKYKKKHQYHWRSRSSSVEFVPRFDAQ